MTSRQTTVVVTLIISVALCYVIWLFVTTVHANSRYHADRKVDCIKYATTEVAALVCDGSIDHRQPR